MNRRWILSAPTLLLVLVLLSTPRTGAGQPAELRFPRVPPTEPADVGSKFHVQGGFTMDLLAAEPLTMDPVAMAYDENGLAWVVEMSDYPYTDRSTDVPFRERTTDLPLGRVRILEDTDGDGRFDRSEIFARELSWPTGIALYDGGAYVAATPDIWYLKDTDGDRRADVRRKIFTGFRKFNVQAVMNNLAWGLDHKIYGAGSSNGGTIRNLADPDQPAVTISRHDFCFDPVSHRFEAISGGARFGNSFDDWGQRFVCNIRNPAQHVVLPSRYLARNPYLPVPSALQDIAESGDTLPVYRTSPPEPWRTARARRWSDERDKSYPRSETAAEGFFTSSSGVTVYRGAAYPPEYYNNLFLGEVAGNLVHRQTLTPSGVTFVARRADQNTEFVTSEDNWFRAVNFVNAPDGTLHVLDMYRETIEHPWSIPDDIKALVDLESGRDRGRIYRLSPPGFRVPPRPRLGSATATELVATLANPNSWWRETAQRLIFERRDPAAVEPLRRLLRSSPAPLGRLHALWSLDGLKALDDEGLLAGMSDPAGGVRAHAVLAAEPRLKTSPRLFARVVELAEDEEIRVRFQVAFSLGEVGGPQATRGLMAILRRDGADPWMRVAVLSSLVDDAAPVLQTLLSDAERDPQRLPIERQLALVVGARNRPGEVERVLAALAALPSGREGRVAQSNALLGLGDGLKRAKVDVQAWLSRADSPAAKLLPPLLQDAARIAADDGLTVPARLAAAELLALGAYPTAQPAILPLLDPRQPRELQLAAVRVLAGFADPRVTADLLGKWEGYTPAVRSEVVESLLARADRIPAVLDAMEAGRIPATHVSSARRALLLTHADATIKSRAQSLLGAAAGPRTAAWETYQVALSTAGDRLRGKRAFERECSGCHRLEDKGYDIGPNLSTIRHRSPAEVLMHILDPNREVAPNFVQYVVVTDDGRVSTGVIADETANSVTLKRAENVTEEVLRNNIESMTNTGKSLMPEGLEQKIPPAEMADLLRYLLGPR